MVGYWRRLHKEELHNFYASPYITRVIKSRIRLAGYVACMGEVRNSYNIFVGKSVGKGPLGRCRRT